MSQQDDKKILLEDTISQGISHLRNINPNFNAVVDQIGEIEFKKRDVTFESLIRIIINQQLSNTVAKVIFERLENIFPNTPNTNGISPSQIHIMDSEKLKSIGLSKGKVNYIKSLSTEFIANPNLVNEWTDLDDDSAISEIQKMKGFGPWSANIILLSFMGRSDIFPYGDATLRKAYLNIYGSKLSETLEEIEWARPYRGILALYFWRWVDNGMKPLFN